MCGQTLIIHYLANNYSTPSDMNYKIHVDEDSSFIQNMFNVYEVYRD